MFAYPKKKRKRVALDKFFVGLDASVDETLVSERVGDSYNFRLKNGALCDGMGVKDFTVMTDGGLVVPAVDGEHIKNVYFYRKFDNAENSYDNRVIVYTDAKKMYELSLDGGDEFVLLDKTFDTAPKSVCYKLNGEDVIIFSEGGGIVVYDGQTFTSCEAPEITSMCLHGERLFVTGGGEQTTLWFSDNFDPTNWYVSLTEAGFIDFQDGLGKVLKAVEFCGSVYVFRDTGITRVNGYFDQQSFYTESVPAKKVKIFPGTVTDCGNRIVYLTSDGFCSFDGTYVTPVMSGLKGLIEGGENAVAAYFDGNYYCTVDIKVGDKTERRVLVYDPEDKDYYLTKGFSVNDIVPAYEIDTLFFVLADRNKLGVLDDKARVYNTSLDKAWLNNTGSFGIEKEKILSKINLISYGDCTVRIRSEIGERTLFVNGCRLSQTLIVGLKGKSFSIGFFSSTFGAKISSVSLDFEY